MHETQSQVEFKELDVAHAEQIAKLHIEGIGTGFISSLGTNFVVSLYKAIAQSNSGFGLVAEKNHKVLGFVVFTTNLNNLYKSIIFKKGLLFALLLSCKMCYLERAKKALETLLYPGKVKKMNMPPAELLSISVAPEERRKGLASQLITKGLQQCQKRDIDKVKVLIGADNKPGNNLYLKLGFEFIDQIVNHGVLSNIYVAEIQ